MSPPTEVDGAMDNPTFLIFLILLSDTMLFVWNTNIIQTSDKTKSPPEKAGKYLLTIMKIAYEITAVLNASGRKMARPSVLSNKKQISLLVNRDACESV